MRTHRTSYLKVVVAALGVSVASLALAAYELTKGRIRVPLTAWTLFESRLLCWASVVGLVALGLVCLLVAVGGLFALHEDAKEGRGLAKPRRTGNPMVKANRPGSIRAKRLRAGDYVEVRSVREIEAMLDDRGCLEGLPFMPEMAPYCGTVHRVFKRIDKIIDIVEHTGLRRMSGTVTLEGLRCDGRAHGGCQTGCQLLWKDEWLRRCPGDRARGGESAERAPRDLVSRLDFDTAPSASDVYRCQATELFVASSYLHRWDPRQYLSPLWSGNVTLVEFLRGISIELFNALQRLRGGCEYPFWVGSRLETTPTLSLGLQPGEWVRVRIKDEILQTLDRRNRNRGLWFDREMLRYCGGRFQVLRRVDLLIEERSGRLVRLKNPCVILDGVTARGEFYRFNPQNDYILWREIWLERLDNRAAGAP